jgi:hypothetical protein
MDLQTTDWRKAMSTSINKKIRMLAALLTVMLLLAGLCVPSLAASVIEWNDAKGSLTIQPKYGDSIVSGCTFNIYKVADYDKDSATLHFILTGAFQNSQTEDSNNPAVDINAAATDRAKLAEAASNLARRINNVGESDVVYKLAADETTIKSMSVGVYLVVQTSAPGNYIVSNPFLVFLPYTSADGTSWVYDITANPKLGYNSPSPGGDSYVSVNVTKVWSDTGYESHRPSSITVTLLRDGTSYKTATLNEGNSWKASWTNLSSSRTWTVEETGVPTGYTSLTDSSTSGSRTSYTITNSYDNVPLGNMFSVTKVWNDTGYEGKRPSSIQIGLFRDGTLNQTVTLDSNNKWSYAWADLDQNYVWTVTEMKIPSGYTATVKNSGSAYTITNTYTAGGITPPNNETEIPEGGVPTTGGIPTTPTSATGTHAPQTGLVQWPIPVLLSAGGLLFVAGVVSGRKKRHEDSK